MSEFSYVRAHSLDEAVTLLNEPGLRNRVLAGGTDLVNQFRDGAVSCDRVVDVTHVPELKIIQVDSRITIGAGVTHTDIGASEVLQQQAPFLVQACRQIGSPQIRNIATIGGNVVNAAACADTLPVLVCLGAQAIIATVDGEQRVPVAELVTGAGQTNLADGSLIRAFVFDPLPAGSRTAFLRIGRRRAMSIARLSLAAAGALDQAGRISFIRLVPGAIFAHFRRVTPIEEMLIGRQPGAELFTEAGKRMAEQFMMESGGRWSAPYKERVIAVLTERALEEICAI